MLVCSGWGSGFEEGGHQAGGCADLASRQTWKYRWKGRGPVGATGWLGGTTTISRRGVLWE